MSDHKSDPRKVLTFLEAYANAPLKHYKYEAAVYT
jgi:hypothetical protein